MIILEKTAKYANTDADGFQKFVILFLIGFLIIFAGIIILIVGAVLYGSEAINFGTIIFIGPFPIVVGAGPEATWIILFSVILAVLSIIMFTIFRRGIRKTNT
jgi:uncharacterized membrane protein